MPSGFPQRTGFARFDQKRGRSQGPPVVPMLHRKNVIGGMVQIEENAV
jgi:hypothetical protein